MKKVNQPDCASCGLPMRERICRGGKIKAPQACPTTGRKELIDQAKKRYKDPEIGEFARQASIQEGSCYADREKKPYVMHPTKPRIQEICEFAGKMGYTRIGLVFCAGLAKEGLIVGNILKSHGLEVISVICKVGGVPKEEIGIKEEEKVFIGEHESMCNPIAQAMIVNDAKVEFNVLLGLCVGHDSLFFKHAKAPTTVLAVKDRVTGHSPLAPIYLSGTYYGWIRKQGE
jgi:uncharacterized metal-binding protein